MSQVAIFATITVCALIAQLLIGGLVHEFVTESIKNPESLTSKFIRKFPMKQRVKVFWAMVLLGEIYLVVSLVIVLFYLWPRVLIGSSRSDHEKARERLAELDSQ